MSKTPKQKDKIFRMVSKVEYLKEILRRHKTEYIEIRSMVNEYNFTHERGIGFWSLARIIFPVIETVAFTIGKKKESFLEEDLGVPFGHLVWELYRHALMHSDELRYAVYKEKTTSWAIHLGNENIGHLVAKHTDSHPATIHIDISKLYFALQEFLVKEITKNDTSPISIQVGIHFSDKRGRLINELEELYIKY